MADRHIGALPAAPDLYDDSLLAAEQQGRAVKVSGKQFKGFAQSAVSQYVDAAQKAAGDALAAVGQIGTAAADAQASANRAEDARSAVENMTAAAKTLEPESAASVEKTTVNGAVHLTFGIPKGRDGTSFVVRGRVDTLEELEAVHPAGKPGDAYAVGTAQENTIYLWSEDAGKWQDVGPLQGTPGEPGPQGPAGPAGTAGPGVPTGGASGQVLAKKSAANYDTQWIDPPKGSGTADVDLSAYAPKDSPVFINSVSLARKEGSVVGIRSAAFGMDTVASNGSSFAEGSTTQSTGIASHAEGYMTVASGDCAHAEGASTTASLDAAHAEGYGTTASGWYAHAEGTYCKASNIYAHAQGFMTEASGKASCSCGIHTIAAAQGQMVIGYPNVSSTDENDKFMIGNGSFYDENVTARSNCFRVTGNGVYAKGSYNASGADYAEMFEWLDGNPNAEDRVGRFVTLDGAKIRLAGPDDDYILGIVSGSPSVVGDVHDDQWQGMYLSDLFGRPVTEEAADGQRRQMLSPDYDGGQPYRPRSARPEWDAVGMLGKLVAVDGGSCQVNGWCTAGENGFAVCSKERTRFRVMERLDDTHIRVLIL